MATRAFQNGIFPKLVAREGGASCCASSRRKRICSCTHRAAGSLKRIEIAVSDYGPTTSIRRCVEPWIALGTEFESVACLAVYVSTRLANSIVYALGGYGTALSDISYAIKTQRSVVLVVTPTIVVYCSYVVAGERPCDVESAIRAIICAYCPFESSDWALIVALTIVFEFESFTLEICDWELERSWNTSISTEFKYY